MAHPRKKNARANAALNAMRPYGFPDRLILRHLKQLLRVYGKDNWFFIEDNAYKVLLESILEQAEQDTSPQLPHQELHQDDDDTVAGPSREIPAFLHSGSKASEMAPQMREVLESASQLDGGCDTPSVTLKADGGSGHVSPTGEVSGSNQINMDPIEKQTTVIETSSGVDQIDNTKLSPSHQHVTHSPHATGAVKSRGRRRPCHGWIESDEEESEVEFVELKPMPLPPELANLLGERVVHQKRKTSGI